MQKSELKKRRWWKWLLAVLLVLALLAGGFVAWYYNLLPARHYSAEHFGITTLVSPCDANQNGVDDYADIVEGARIDAQNHPRYDGSYWAGGYPPEDVGVCTDVVWRAFAHAGYDLKAMVDLDIGQNVGEYPRVGGTPDPNIDFRRVPNLNVFFARHGQVLSLDLAALEEWQPGDIVVFKGPTWHIAIVSDRRNADGVPWLIHNGGQPRREEDAMSRLLLHAELMGHYRWTPGEGSIAHQV